eukprot:7122331-Pyramimonas_sp.AAC.1
MTDQHATTVLMDMAKCYETIGLPLRLAWCLIMQYSQPRCGLQPRDDAAERIVVPKLERYETDLQVEHASRADE